MGHKSARKGDQRLEVLFFLPSFIAFGYTYSWFFINDLACFWRAPQFRFRIFTRSCQDGISGSSWNICIFFFCVKFSFYFYLSFFTKKKIAMEGTLAWGIYN